MVEEMVEVVLLDVDNIMLFNLDVEEEHSILGVEEMAVLMEVVEEVVQYNIEELLEEEVMEVNMEVVEVVHHQVEI